jgi:rhodanese-related sulfurtransferase
VLAAAGSCLDRFDPAEAISAVGAGAVRVDIRPRHNRDAEGAIPGALVIERDVLKWRLDPMFLAAQPIAAHDLHVIVVCKEGYTSSLAAASLRDLGSVRAAGCRA